MKISTIYKKNLIVFILIVYAFTLNSCASRNMVNWIPFWGSEKEHYATQDKHVEQFISKVRPSHINQYAYYLLASYYQDRGRHKEAIREFIKVISINPDHIKAYNGMGISYDFMGDYQSAIESYKAALIRAEVDYVHNNIGYSYLLQGNYDAAIDAFQKAIALNSQNSRFYSNLGIAYAKKGLFNSALHAFKKAGNEAMAYYQIARVYYEQGFYDKAKHFYTKALAFNPSLDLAQNALIATEAMLRISRPHLEKSREEVFDLAQLDSVKPEGLIASVRQDKTAGKPVKEKTGVMLVHSRPPSKKAETDEMIVSKTTDPASEQNYPLRGEIEISNGNGVNRMATKIGTYLNNKGFAVVRLTNADNFNYPKTKIYYKEGYLHAAYRVAQHIPGYQNMGNAESFNRPGIKIKVLIGRDIIPHKKAFERS